MEKLNQAIQACKKGFIKVKNYCVRRPDTSFKGNSKVRGKFLWGTREESADALTKMYTGER